MTPSTEPRAIFKRRRTLPVVAIVAIALLGVAAPSYGAFELVPGSVDGGAFTSGGAAFTQAGGHPDNAWFNFDIVREQDAFGNIVASGALRDITVGVPPGFLGIPSATPKCGGVEAIASFNCPPASQVGVVAVTTSNFVSGSCTPCSTNTLPVYNMEPASGAPALLAFTVGGVIVTVVPSLRSDDDFGIDVKSSSTSQGVIVYGATFTLWGLPASPAHDADRGYVLLPGDSSLSACANTSNPACSNSAGVAVRPFLANPTACTPAGQGLDTDLLVESWSGEQVSDGFTTHLPPGFPAPMSSWGPPQGPTDCDQVPFDPTATIQPTSAAPDSATGIDFDLSIPQPGLSDPDVLATAHLDKTVVTLPEGLSVNPSGAAGLEGCSDQEIGLVAEGNPPRFNDEDPLDGSGVECPASSRIGTVEISTPLLDDVVTGDVVLGEPRSTNPRSGQMFRLFIVARHKLRGILVKIYGSAVADPATGRLAATFDKNPQLPFSDLSVKLKGGARGLLATQPRCSSEPDEYQSVSMFYPWSQALLSEADKEPTVVEQNWTVGGPCEYDFDPGLKAGMSNAGARQGGTFGFEFTRPQGDQAMKGLTAELPTGLLASTKDFPLCTNAQADAGNCPASSRIGLVDASAGSGDPFVLERKGEVFLTEGYKSGPYGLAVKVRAIAGPFRGAMELSPIIVRQKIEVNPTTAQVKAISDPFPTIWHGVPLRVRRVLVNVDRPDFMLNPSDCSAKQVRAHLTSIEGTVRTRSNHFQASGCAALPFKPKLALSLSGKKQTKTGKHPGVKAQVNQTGIGEAGIRRARVALPKSLALDPNNAQALCEFTDGTKDDLENHCPKGSIVGRARAVSPLLNDPLAGNVYFVKNIRIDPKSGNQIRTLPMIIVALRGEIAINLKGESSTTKGGKLVNTFNAVPDAPISRFNLNIKGGKSGIIAVTRTRKAKINLCAGRHIAEADMDGQNGRRHDFDIRMKTPCTKKQTKAAKRAAAKARKAARR